jgi:hypothetical protein
MWGYHTIGGWWGATEPGTGNKYIYIYTPNDPQFIAIIKEWGTYTGKMGISHEFLGRPVKGTGLLWVFKRVVMVQNPCLIQVIPTAMPLWA